MLVTAQLLRTALIGPLSNAKGVSLVNYDRFLIPRVVIFREILYLLRPKAAVGVQSLLSFPTLQVEFGSHLGGVVGKPGLSKRRIALREGLVRCLLQRFLTNFWGSMVSIFVCRNLQLRTNMEELAFIFLQATRIFAQMPATLRTPRQVQNYSWRYGALVLYLAVRLRDVSLLFNWMQDRLLRFSMFQHRRFFRALGIFLKLAVLNPTLGYALRGLQLQVTGKISVTGNAMTRTFLLKTGAQANASTSLRINQGFTLVRTNTGCLGVWLKFFF